MIKARQRQNCLHHCKIEYRGEQQGDQPALTWILPELAGLCKLCVLLLIKPKALLPNKADAFVMYFFDYISTFCRQGLLTRMFIFCSPIYSAMLYCFANETAAFVCPFLRSYSPVLGHGTFCL